jgi:hypothetical protein
MGLWNGWQGENEEVAAVLATEGECAVHEVCELAGNGEPKADGGGDTRLLGDSLVGVEHAVSVIGWDFLAVV